MTVKIQATLFQLGNSLRYIYIAVNNCIVNIILDPLDQLGFSK